MLQKIITLIVLISGQLCHAQGAALEKKVNLDDVQIKGEAQGNGMSVLARTKNSLDGRIPVRTHFKNEIVQELPSNFSTVKKEKK